MINDSTSPTGSRNHLASFRFQNTFLLNVWNRDGDRWFSDPVGEVLNEVIFEFIYPQKVQGTLCLPFLSYYQLTVSQESKMVFCFQ